jgi:hypothetical protein
MRYEASSPSRASVAARSRWIDTVGTFDFDEHYEMRGFVAIARFGRGEIALD